METMSRNAAWNPISTPAPLGRPVLVIGDNFGDPRKGKYYLIGWWDGADFSDKEEHGVTIRYATHWAELPPHPKEEKTNQSYDLDKEDHTETRVFVQYKNTSICLDFWCKCGAVGHFDGDFAHNLKCPACKTVFAMPPMLFPKALDGEPEVPPRLVELDEDSDPWVVNCECGKEAVITTRADPNTLQVWGQPTPGWCEECARKKEKTDGN